MPSNVDHQAPDGRWFVDVEPIKGKRFRKRFKTKMEAQQFEVTARQKCAGKPQLDAQPKDRRRLSGVGRTLV